MHNRNLINRLLTAFIFIVIFFTLFYFSSNLISKIIFLLAIIIALPLGLREFVLMGKKLGYKPSLMAGTLSGWNILLYFFLRGSCFPLWLAISLAMMIICFSALFFERDLSNALMNQSLTLLATLYMSISLGFQVKLFMVNSAILTNIGWRLILALYLIVWLGDSAAYFLGGFFGRHKLAPRISPKKTWEGAIGNLIGNLVAAFAIKYLVFSEWSSIDALAIAVLLGITGQLGDLVESAWKRSADIKDSDAGGGIIIPGHGGLLDRIDSLAFSAPAFYAYVHFILGLN